MNRQITEMFQDVILFCKISFSSWANRVIYVWRQVPLMQQVLSERLYRYQKRKCIFALAGMWFQLLKTILVQDIITYCLIYDLPFRMQREGQEFSAATAAFLFIIIQCIVPALRKSELFQNSQKDYTFLNHFMMNPTKYYRCKLLLQIWKSSIALLPILFYIFVYHFGKGMLWIQGLLCVKCGCVLAGHWFYVNWYRHFQRLPRIWKSQLLCGALVVTAYFLAYLGVFSDNGCYVGDDWRFLHWSMTVGIEFGLLFLSVLLFIRLWHYENYRAIAVQYAGESAVTIQISVADTADIERKNLLQFTWEKNKAYAEANKDMLPEQYFNRTLIYRMSGVLKKRYRQTTGGIFIIFIVLGLLVRMGIGNVSQANIMDYASVLVFILLSNLFGTLFCRMLFRNGDLPLFLSRQKQNNKLLRQGMLQRYGILLRWDILLSLVTVGLGLGCFSLVSRITLSMVQWLVLGVLAVCTCVLFDTWHLCMYYLLQPYGENIEMICPAYKAASMIEGIFIHGLLFIRSNPKIEVIFPVLIGTVTASVVLLCLTSMLAPKTFHLRK